jgi:hypothetical protein
MAGSIRLSAEELEICKVVGMTAVEYAEQKLNIMRQRAKWREYSRRYRMKKKLLKMAAGILES